MININNINLNRRRVQRNTPKRVWGFGMVWKAEIYYQTVEKDGHPALERLTGYAMYIYEWI